MSLIEGTNVPQVYAKTLGFHPSRREWGLKREKRPNRSAPPALTKEEGIAPSYFFLKKKGATMASISRKLDGGAGETGGGQDRDRCTGCLRLSIVDG